MTAIFIGDMGRGRLARTYASREGDMTWGQLEPVLTDNLWCRGIPGYSEGLGRLVQLYRDFPEEFLEGKTR